MKKKSLLSLLIISGALSLTSCSLFDDSDIMHTNTYDPIINRPEVIPDDAVIAGGVIGKEIDALPDTLAFKNIVYSEYDEVSKLYKVENTYKEGGAHHMGYHVNGDMDYSTDQPTDCVYDLYVPNFTPRNAKHEVVLFIHGGAWVSGFKTDVNPYIFEFAKKGYVTATIKYSLLNMEMKDTSLSIFRNLDEIDQCLKSIKSVLEELKFDTSKSELIIGGASSGSHLCMLYTYSRGKEAPLPIKFIVNAVGPVDIKEYAWKAFKNPTDAVLDGGVDKNAIADQEAASNIGELKIADDSIGNHNWTDYWTAWIANGMCGLPYTKEEMELATDSDKNYVTNPTAPAYVNMTTPDMGEDQLSVTYWINKADEASKFPIICAYAAKDGVVGINQFATLQAALDAKGIKYYSKPSDDVNGYIYFRNSKHDELTKTKDPTNYQRLVDAVESWASLSSI